MFLQNWNTQIIKTLAIRPGDLTERQDRDVVQSAAQLNIIAGQCKTDAEVLQELLFYSTDFLIGNLLAIVVHMIPDELQDHPIVRFLHVVVAYSDKRQKRDQTGWNGLYQKLMLFQPSEDRLFSFFLENYLFLTGRNAGLQEECLVGHFEKARSFSDACGSQRSLQLLGFITFNRARQLLSLKKDEALVLYTHAILLRSMWLSFLLLRGFQDDDFRVRFAATNLWLALEAFNYFFSEEVMNVQTGFTLDELTGRFKADQTWRVKR